MKDKLSNLVFNILNVDNNIKKSDIYKTSYLTKIYKKNFTQEKQTIKTIKKKNLISNHKLKKSKTTKASNYIDISKKLSKKNIISLKKNIKSKGGNNLLKALSKKRNKSKNKKKLIKEINWIKLYLLDEI